MTPYEVVARARELDGREVLLTVRGVVHTNTNGSGVWLPGEMAPRWLIVNLDELLDLVGLQADLDELESTDAIVKAAAVSYANMVARVTGAPDAEIMKACRVLQADLEAAQDEIERLLSEKEALRAELARQGVVTDHTVGCSGLCKTCEAIRPSICPPCSAGDHSRHRADLAGVCIGCACVVAS